MKRNKLLIAVVALGLAACSDKNENPAPLPDAKPIVLRHQLQAGIQQSNEFAFDLLKKTLEEEKENPNVLLSPLSVSMALSMTWNGAVGETQNEMGETLNLSGLTSDEFNEYNQTLQKELLAVDPSTRLKLANSIWYRQDLPIKQSFLDINRDYYQAEIKGLDFTHPEAVKTINNWCAHKTEQLIPEIIDRIPGDAVMYLINAVYFKGTWRQPFNKENTYSGNFTAEKGTGKQVKMMKQQSVFNYTWDEDAAYLDMPYGNNAFSMTVILPQEGKTVEEVLDNLSSEKVTSLLKDMKDFNVEVHLPRFKIEYNILLNMPLQHMGMKLAFGKDADFSSMADAPLCISRVIHKTFAEVNEEGTEAAAATAVEIFFTSPGGVPSYTPFVVNKPFIFLIREKSTGVILFLGKMGDIN